MPIYEYVCEKCAEKIEKMQKMSDKPLENCTNADCDGKLNKLISSSGIQFKGTGWYVTDYSDKLKKDKESSKPSKKSDAKTEKPSCAEKCPVACENKQ